MQTAEAGNKSAPRGEEESINFRPSPNFKHMKKYLKSKFEEMNAIGASESNNEQEKLPQHTNIQNETVQMESPAKKQNPVETSPAKQQMLIQTSPAKQQMPIQTSPAKQQIPVETSPAKQQISVQMGPTKQQTPAANTTPQQTAIQPPLPPNPPPESPLDIKQEVMDEEYEYMNTQNPTGLEQIITEYKTDPLDHTPDDIQEQSPEPEEQKLSGSEPTMCRNFVRGTCKKGESCIFRHELIISQLPGVYTFCRNYQNRQCTYTRCKFVHATVFEKEHFFRTGYLPPHATAHLKQSAAPPPPPPPPEEPPAQEVPAYYTALDVNTGVNMTDLSAMNGMTDYMYQPQMQNVNDIYTAGPSTSTDVPIVTSPIKRNWNETVTTDTSTFGQLDDDIPTLKKCKDCDTNEFRYQYHRNKVENMLTSAEEMNTKMAILNAKTERLWTVLVTLFKPQSNTSIFGGMSTTIGDKERAILEQMSLLTSSASRMSFMSEEDNVKNMLNNNLNFQNIIAKMFANSTDQPSIP